MLYSLALDKLSGKFDGYSTAVSFLHKRYLPAGSTKLDFPSLFEKILDRQAVGQRTFAFEIGSTGELICPEIAEPMGDEPLTPLVITGSCDNLVKFDPKEWTFKPSMILGPGYVGRIEWEGDDCGYASPESAEGFIKLRKVWESESGKALYEGFWEVKVKYDKVLSRKGHGKGRDYRGSF